MLTEALWSLLLKIIESTFIGKREFDLHEILRRHKREHFLISVVEKGTNSPSKRLKTYGFVSDRVRIWNNTFFLRIKIKPIYKLTFGLN